jgi:hypothetical protein
MIETAGLRGSKAWKISTTVSICGLKCLRGTDPVNVGHCHILAGPYELAPTAHKLEWECPSTPWCLRLISIFFSNVSRFSTHLPN